MPPQIIKYCTPQLTQGFGSFALVLPILAHIKPANVYYEDVLRHVLFWLLPMRKNCVAAFLVQTSTRLRLSHLRAAGKASLGIKTKAH